MSYEPNRTHTSPRNFRDRMRRQERWIGTRAEIKNYFLKSLSELKMYGNKILNLTSIS